MADKILHAVYDDDDKLMHAVKDLRDAFEKNKLPGSLDNSIYFNIKKMQEIQLK